MKKWNNLIIFLGGALGVVVSLLTLLRFSRSPDRSRNETPKMQAVRQAIATATAGTPYTNLNETLYAQALHETGIFTSRIFREKNNLFGMKVPKQRKTYATNQGSNDTYSNFDTLKKSVEDLLLWFKMHNYIPKEVPSIQAYAEFLKSKGYYTDTVDNYASGMRNLLNQYGKI